MEITVPGSGIWPPVVVVHDTASQVQIWQNNAGPPQPGDFIILDPADLDALIAALQAAKEQANG